MRSAGHALQPTLNILGMFVMPRSPIPLPYANKMLDEDGEVVELSDLAGKIVRHLPRSLTQLVRCAAALRDVRQSAT